MAEKQARSNLDVFMPDKAIDPLDSTRHLEAEHCWLFFRNPEIKVPPHARLVDEAAYCVGKRGGFAMIQDYTYDPARLMEYLQTMSDYFGAR